MVIIKRLVLKILGMLTSATATQGFTNSVTFSNSDYAVGSINVAKSGYLPLGVVGIYPAGNTVTHVVTRYVVDNNTLTYTLRHLNGSKTGTETSTFVILYAKLPNWGGYRLTALFHCFVERWWRYADYQGMDCEGTECHSWFGEIHGIVPGCEQHTNITCCRRSRRDKTSRRSLCCIFLIWLQNKYNERCINSSIPIRFSGWVHLGNCKPILLSLLYKRSGRHFVRQQRRLLDANKPTVDGEHRVSCFGRRDNEKNRYVNIAISERGCAVC